MDLRRTWDESADAWAEFASSPEHDVLFWRFHLPSFVQFLPPPGKCTVDLGAGEGRLTAELSALGHRVVAIDSSLAVSRHAKARGIPTVVVSDAAAAPLEDGIADLVVSFMALQDMDDPVGAVTEAARVLGKGGRFCLAIAHPLRSAGGFESKEPDSSFFVSGSYFEQRPWPWSHSHTGLTVSIPSEHRSIEYYANALEGAGFFIEALREPRPDASLVESHPPLLRWTRLPCFLHVRAVKR